MPPRSLPLSRLALPRLVAPLAVVAVLTTACGSTDEGTAAPVPTPSPATSSAPASPAAASPAPEAAPSSASDAEPVTVTISSFDYDVPASVPAGAELVGVNEDAEAHTFTLRDGESVVVQGGATATITAPGTAGSYEVVCDLDRKSVV